MEKTTIVQKNEPPFPSLLKKVETIPSESGKEIYEWEYLDADGKIQNEKSNVYEKIQSFKRQTDYKLRIEKGEQINDGTGVFMDISSLGDSYSDLDKYIGDIVNRLKQDLQSQSVQGQNGVNNSQSSKAEPKSQETPKQTIGETNKGDGN